MPSHDRFVYFVPFLPVRRNLCLGTAVFFPLFLFACLLFAHVRAADFLQPVMWILIAIFCIPSAIFLRFAFPPRTSLARLEFDRDYFRYIPDRIGRWMGDLPLEDACPAHMSETLLCRGQQDNLTYGFRIILHSSDGHGNEIKPPFLNRLNARESSILTEGIHAATGLPVRLVQRQRLDDGTIQETPWIPAKWDTNLKVLAWIALGVTPIAAGILVGFFAPSLIVSVSVGVALWLGWNLAMIAAARTSPKRQKYPRIYWLSTLLAIGNSYAAAVILTALFHRGQ